MATEEWMACQRHVNGLELKYADAMAAYCRSEGPLPPEAMFKEVQRMRTEAKRLLTAALADIDRRNEKIDRCLDGY
jgi:hypothetical protein